MKEAWIDREKKIISFRLVEGAEYYEAEELIFWDYIKELVFYGYRLQ